MPKNRHTTQATWIFAIYHALQHEGYDAESILATQSIQLKMFKNPQERVHKKIVNALWTKAIQMTGDDAFCLSVLDFYNTSSIDSLISGVKAGQNIGQALEMLSKYYKLISPEIKLSINLEKDICINIDSVQPDQEWLPDDIDITLALITKYGRSLPVNELKPSRIALKRPKPTQHKKYADFFQCPIEFNAESSLICYPLEELSSPIADSEPDQWVQVERTLAGKHMVQFHTKPEQTFNLCVRHYLFEKLGPDFPNLNKTATHFNMSISAFKKRLKSEGSHFQSLSDEIRKEEACRLITLKSLPLKQIAYQLGFTTNSVFNRAFKRWTNLSPGEYISAKKQKLADKNAPCSH